MTSSLDSKVQHNVLISAPLVRSISFNRVAIIDEHPTGPLSVVIQDLSDAQAALDNGDITQSQFDAITSALSQDSVPDQFIAGNRRADQAQTDEIVVDSIGSASQGDTIAVDINGTEASDTLDSSPTTDSAATKLKDAINATSEPVTASVSGSTIFVVADTAGVPFDTTESSANDNEIDLTIATVTENINIQKELARINDDNPFFGFSIDSRDKTQILRADEYANASNFKMFGAQTSSLDVLSELEGNVYDTLGDRSSLATMPWWYSQDDKHLAFALMSYKLAVDPSTTKPLWPYTTLTGFEPDTPGTLNATDIAALERQNVNYYGRLKEVPATYGSTMANGRHADFYVSISWLDARVEERFAQKFLDLSNTNRPLLYDDTGIGDLQGEVRLQWLEGVAADRFRNNLSIEDVDPEEVPDSVVRSRELAFRYGGTQTGAIESVDVTGIVALDFDGF